MAYGAIAAVMLAAISSITILPAILGILGKRIDALTFKKLRQTKTNEEIENGFWGKLTRWVMQHPLKVAVPIVAALLLMIIPLTGIKFGGINETYLPPDSPTRVAQAQFDELFPGNRTEPVRLVIEGADNTTLGQISKTANAAPGLVEKFTPEVATKDGVNVLKAGLTERNEARPTIDYLRSADWPEGTTVLVGGTPAIEQDSVDALLDRLPLMVVSVILLTTLLMFLTFGSLVLPIKAALMSALGLGSTLGILTWIFIDGHGSGLLNFTPGPIMSPVLVLIIAIVYGLSTDYEVFLLSRMVEARAQGASTTESIRIGTAHTGRIITAAALILIVVTGAFGLSDLVMMKYISYGMISALIIDATLIRMFLVPATMKLLGDDCWWAPAWMKRIQQKIGLGEPILDNELVLANVPQIAPVGAIAGPGQPRKIEAASRVMPPPAPLHSRKADLAFPILSPSPFRSAKWRSRHPTRSSRRGEAGTATSSRYRECSQRPPEPDRGTGTQSLVPAATECQRQAQKPHARCAGRASHRELVVGPAGPGTDSPGLTSTAGGPDAFADKRFGDQRCCQQQFRLQRREPERLRKRCYQRLCNKRFSPDLGGGDPPVAASTDRSGAS